MLVQKKLLTALTLCLLILTGCASTYSDQVSFPPADDLFVTTGDGDITRPYTPVGQLIYLKKGYRLGLPLIGLLSIDDVDPGVELRRGVLEEARRMGGDGVINVQLDWIPPSDGFLGFRASGGQIVVYGTVIRR